MTITRVKPAGWGTNEQLTSAQQNAVDINVTNAVDKRSGQSDTVQSNLAFSGANSHSGAETFDNITATGATHYKLASRSVTRQICCYGESAYDAAGTKLHWSLANTGFRFLQIAFGLLEFDFDAPDGATITGFKCYVDAGTGRGGLPTQPTLVLYRIKNDGTTATIGTATDAQGSLLLYQALHNFSATGLTEVVDRSTMRYVFQLTGEGGGNFLANQLKLISVEVTMTITRVDDAQG